MDAQSDIQNYLAGNPESIVRWEALQKSDEFFSVCLPILANYKVMDETHTLFILILISRTINSKECISVDVVTNLTPLLLQLSFETSLHSTNQKIRHNAAACIAKMIVSMKDETQRSLIQRVLQEVSNNSMVALSILLEIPIAGFQADDSTKETLKELSSVVANLCSSSLFIDCASMNDREMLCSNSIMCANQWILSGFLSLEQLFSPSQSSSQLSSPFFETVASMMCVPSVDIAQATADLLYSVSKLKDIDESPDTAQNYANYTVMASSSIVSDDTLSVTDLLRHTSDTFSMVITSNADSLLLSFTSAENSCFEFAKILSSLTKILGSTIFQEKNERILSISVIIATRCGNNLNIANTCLETILYAKRCTPKRDRKSARLKEFWCGVVDVALQRVLPPDTDNSDIDIDEWLQLRDQTCSDLFQACYLDIRSTLLVKIRDTLLSQQAGSPACIQVV